MDREGLHAWAVAAWRDEPLSQDKNPASTIRSAGAPHGEKAFDSEKSIWHRECSTRMR
jgi:hypothetical protein